MIATKEQINKRPADSIEIPPRLIINFPAPAPRLTGCELRQEVANRAAMEIKKPGKEVAFSTLRAMIERVPFDADEIKSLSILYSFFLPARKTGGAKGCSDLQWCGRACSTDTTRPAIMHAFVDSGYLVGTDGRRLHSVKTDLPKGYYDAAGEKLELDLTPPNWKQVVPDVEGMDKRKGCTIAGLARKVNDDGDIVYDLPTYGGAMVRVLAQYLEEAAGKDEFTIYTEPGCEKEHLGPVVLDIAGDGKRRAVIMPRRIG